MAGRQLPRSIDFATPVANGHGVSVGIDELRFTRAEFRSYFGDELSRERHRALWDELQGWPVAACLQRNLTHAGQTELLDVSINWVETCLMRGLAEEDRRVLVAAACFEWADAALVDEVLGPGTTFLLRDNPILRGLVQEIDQGETFRLHPLIRRYAEKEIRSRDDGADLRRRMAGALAARGRTTEAMRQANKADDAVLAGEILERAGAVRLFLAAGVEGLADAVALVSDAVIDASPRLTLARVAASAMADRSDDRGVYERILTLTDSGRTDVDDELRIDALVVRGILLMCGCAPVGSPEVRSTIGEIDPAMDENGLGVDARAVFSYGQAYYRFATGDLAAALAAARRVGDFAVSCPTISLDALILEGAILFARGDVAEAETVWMQAQRTIRQHFAGHDSLELARNVFAAECALESNRHAGTGDGMPSLARLAIVGGWLDVYAAAVDVRVEHALRQNAPARVSGILREAWQFARERGLESFTRWLTVFRVTASIRAGHLDEAKELWREAGLPTHAEALFDIEGQSWREMEALGCARLRLLVAGEEYADALALGRLFAARARDSGLARTESHATALAMRAAWLAGDPAAAHELLAENLRLFHRTGFSRALIEHNEVASAVLRGFDADDAVLRTAKEAILQAIGFTSVHRLAEKFTAREFEILARLSVARDKEIARELGLTDNGVRYHIKNIFGKLGVSNRREATEKARLMGVVESGRNRDSVGVAAGGP